MCSLHTFTDTKVEILWFVQANFLKVDLIVGCVFCSKMNIVPLVCSASKLLFRDLMWCHTRSRPLRREGVDKEHTNGHGAHTLIPQTYSACDPWLTPPSPTVLPSVRTDNNRQTQLPGLFKAQFLIKLTHRSWNSEEITQLSLHLIAPAEECYTRLWDQGYLSVSLSLRHAWSQYGYMLYIFRFLPLFPKRQYS